MVNSLKTVPARRLFLHIGYPKTGTSSIQRAFFNERVYLEEADGLLYPRACVARPEFGHHNIAWQARADSLYNPGNGGIDELREECRLTNADTVLVSSEALVGLLADDPEHFQSVCARLSRGYELTLIVTVRRIDEFVESGFLQQFNAWMWDRPMKHSADFATYVAEFDVDRHLAPIRYLLASDYRLRFVAHGPGMVQRMAESIGLALASIVRLRSWGDTNQRWLGLKAIAVLGRLTGRDDADILRKTVSRNRPAFRQLLCGLKDDTTGYRLMDAESARSLMRLAEPVYRELGAKLHQAVVRGGAQHASTHDGGTHSASLSADETRRINEFFGRPVL